MKKGDIVVICAEVYTIYEKPEIYIKTQAVITSPGLYEWEVVHTPTAPIYRYDSQDVKSLIKKIFVYPFNGLVIGKTYLATGVRETGYQSTEDGDYDPPYLLEDKRHFCWLVEPMTSNRWLKPIHCLEDDLVVI